jgi:hypothetical protein
MHTPLIANVASEAAVEQGELETECANNASRYITKHEESPVYG